MRWLGKVNLGVKVFLVILCLLLTTLIIVSHAYYRTMSRQLITQYSQDMQMRVIQTNTIMDLQLSRMEDNSSIVLQDRDILRILEELRSQNSYEVLSANREVQRILGKYFGGGDWMYAYNILSPSVKLGQSYVPHAEFFTSDLGKRIVEENGRPIWYPTYDFAEQFGLDYLRDVETDFRRLFSVGRVFRGLDTTSDPTIRELTFPETYVLLLCIRETFFQDHYAELLQDETMVAMATPGGQILSASGEDARSLVQEAAFFPEILSAGSGTELQSVGADQVVLCYDTSSVTGWTLLSATYTKNLLAGASATLFWSSVGFVIPLALVSLMLAVLVSLATTRPMRQLFRAIGRTGKGDFISKIPVQGYGEFSRLIAQFNNMNDHIAQLIDENYRMKLHEKESQIEALNAQLNPHFLYNTLNLVNCMAIESGTPEIAGVVRALSKSLRYTVDNIHAQGVLRKELEWLESYVYIMACRYEEQLHYDCRVEEDLLEGKVPRLFLQPFVENAFVHGFRDRQEGCRLTVRGRREGAWRCFTIRDNGCGMAPEKLKTLLEGPEDAVGIRNTYRRMQLMYESQCHLEIRSELGMGTMVILRLP